MNHTVNNSLENSAKDAIRSESEVKTGNVKNAYMVLG